ncbi:GNAT family N-acetyltransferase [Domibacillus sp. DTU_2020_1001157_1_SI_ALB_TIR_016]|uniref:GNAT family N-acetyltransferase n=1 Tax=Domibacillus sp. DTU_2020_1001157_1_SI_ALB_TIR_016 TaxID=3077789 RepID=UPI0028EE5FB7|nr:GNAT family N-acetyltransferase [Domibacillus sp. DTU_2020_1001157_1_SI_ALB_TIR_016]WNS81213.1 GNAT family N-acetyltransferase [Domibacillus sp. DTU_2020_1001157_1_SI_ALB_TIR_016]
MIEETTAYELLSSREGDRWNRLVESCESYDVFSLADYLALYEQRGEGSARLFVYEESSNRYVLYPFLLRDIPERVGGETYFDIITPYGYGGPLYSGRAAKNDLAFNRRFRETFSRYCRLEGIVSEFIRFHPYQDNEQAIQDHMVVSDVGDIVYNNLLLPEEDIWADTAPSKKRRIKKSKKNGVAVQFTEGTDVTAADIEMFHTMYTETMDKKHASPFYYFPLPFLNNYFQALAPYITLAWSIHDGQPVAANLILKTGEFATIHLSASVKEHLPLCPNCRLRYACILWAKENGFTVLDHGGGKEKGDSLFAYKRQFSKNLLTYKTGKKIHLTDIYESLASRLPGRLERERADFFPEYRKAALH